MNAAAWVIVLGVGGGLAQIVGLFLVIADVLADRRHAAAIRVERPRRERVDWKSMYLRVHGSQIAPSVKGGLSKTSFGSLRSAWTTSKVE